MLGKRQNNSYTTRIHARRIPGQPRSCKNDRFSAVSLWRLDDCVSIAAVVFLEDLQ